MRDYELELIAALAEGTLEDEAEARALIESSPEHRAEYESQRSAVEFLAAAQPVRMTDGEKAALHRDLWTELRSSPSARSNSTPWYLRWAPAAAGLLVVVGVVSVLTQSGPEGTSVFGEISADLSSADTTIAASGGDDADRGSVEESLGEGGGEALAPASDGQTSGAALDFSDEVEKLRAEGLSEMTDAYQEASDDPELQECVTRADFESYRVLGTIPNPEMAGDDEATRAANSLIVAIPAGGDLESSPIALIDLLTCELIHFDG